MNPLRESFHEVLQAVTPVVLFILLIQVAWVRLPSAIVFQFAGGALMVYIGMIMFMLGIRVGILPLGEAMGAALPKLRLAWVLVGMAVILGFVITLAEPDVRILASQVELASHGTIGRAMLIAGVAAGVAIFVGLSMVRLIYGWSLTPLLIIGYTIVLVLALLAPLDIVPVSLDAGGVTTGPMTVPFILALGVGISSVLRGKRTSTDGFGMVALASIGPIIAVLIMGMVIK